MRLIGSGRDSEPAVDGRNKFAFALRPRRSGCISPLDAIGCRFLVLVSVRGTGGRHSLEDAELGDSCRCRDVCLVGAHSTARPARMGKCTFLDCPLYGNVCGWRGCVVPEQPPTPACGGTGISRSPCGIIGSGSRHGGSPALGSKWTMA